MGFLKNAALSAGFASLAMGHAHRVNRGTVPIDGKIWTSCVTKGQIALTFDDGPYIYTQKIVDALTASGHKATFFQNGQNYDSILNYGPLLNSMIAGGHQVASHTWSHADLATLTPEGITSEMGQLEAAHVQLIGKAPTYMRPPYLSLNDQAVTTLKSLGYKIVEVDIDTQDWAEGPIGAIDLSIQWFEGNFTNGGSLSLNHDVYQPTADDFVPAIITYLNGKGLKSVTAGECLGDDPANWYRAGSSTPSSVAPGQSSTPAPSGTAPSGNGTAPGKPTGSYGYPGPSGYPGSGSGPGRKGPCGGGDTEPGHGPDAGRGSMPGHKGEGNHGTPPSGSSGYGGGYGGGYGSSGSGHGTASNSTGSSPTGTKPQPSYYSNAASSLSGSAAVLGLGALALLL